MVRYSPSSFQLLLNMLPQHEPAEAHTQTHTQAEAHTSTLPALAKRKCESQTLELRSKMSKSIQIFGIFCHIGACVLPTVRCVLILVRERRTTSGKHYSDSCSTGFDYTGNEARGRGRVREASDEVCIV